VAEFECGNIFAVQKIGRHLLDLRDDECAFVAGIANYDMRTRFERLADLEKTLLLTNCFGFSLFMSNIFAVRTVLSS